MRRRRKRVEGQPVDFVYAFDLVNDVPSSLLADELPRDVRETYREDQTDRHQWDGDIDDE